MTNDPGIALAESYLNALSVATLPFPQPIDGAADNVGEA
jgi:hypothetical protein